MAEMALLAAFPPGPVPDGASAMPRVVRWTDGWGRAGDAGVVAWHDGQRIGAAWCRVQADQLALDNTGNPLAEIAIAVSEGHRSRGAGQALLLALEGEALAAGHAAVCLAVNALNPAFRLYERLGFEVVEREGSRLTMVKHLSRSQSWLSHESLGVRRGVTRNRAYDPRWADEFEHEATRLADLLASLSPRIAHIGSTAVPGLPAKPLLDIALAFQDRATLETARRTLQAAGYEDRGDLNAAGGVVLAKGPHRSRTHLLHLVEASDGQWERWLAFRDALRGDPVLRAAYAALKADLAKRFPDDRASYAAGKRRFIDEAVASAPRPQASVD